MGNYPEKIIQSDSCEEITEDLTEVLPAEVVSLFNYVKGNTPPIDPSEEVEAKPEGTPIPDLSSLIDEMDEEPTVVEEVPRTTVPANPSNRFLRFLGNLLDPYYTPPYPERAKKFFREAREHIKKSKTAHLENFPDTYDLKFLRWSRKVYARCKANLLEKYE